METKKSPCPPLWASLVRERRRTLAYSATSALLHPVYPRAGLPPVYIKKLFPGGKSDSFLADVVVRLVEFVRYLSSRGPRTLITDHPAAAVARPRTYGIRHTTSMLNESSTISHADSRRSKIIEIWRDLRRTC